MGCQVNKCFQIWTFLVNIQIDGAFWFKDNLRGANTLKGSKNHVNSG
jgi:hypothetical protein